MTKNGLKDLRGKVFIVDDPHPINRSPTFYTGFSSYVMKDTKEATLDPYVMFHPKIDSINSNIVWNIYATKPLQIDLRKIGSDISFTKNFRKYEIEVRRLCKGHSAKKLDTYLKIAKRMTNKKIDVDDMVENEDIREKMKSGDFLGFLTENI